MPGRRTTHSEQWWANPPAHVLRCTAHYKSNGDRCRREAAPGTSVCGSHGALTPAVQARAATRIGMSVDDAVKRLHTMLDDDSVEARDKIKILHDLLDRGGLGATSKVLVGVGTTDPVETLFRDLLSDPNALAAPTAPPPALPAGDPRSATFSRDEDEPADYELIGSQIGGDEPDDVVDAEVVEDDRPAHTVQVEGRVSGDPPPRLRRQLERFGLL